MKLLLRLLACVGAGVIIIAGCGPATPPSAPPKAAIVEPEAPKGAAIADPVLREAREEADSILASLLAGKLENDPQLATVPKKVKGYQSWSITSQQIVREGTAEFRGDLIAPAGRAKFTMTLVKQKDGRWAVGAFSGPNPA